MKKTLLGFLLFLAGMSISFAQNEYKYEPVFTYNFTKYVKWPDGETGDFIIGIAGNKVALQKFQDFFNNRTRGMQSIVVKEISSSSQIENCDILFLAEESKIDLKEASEMAVKKSILIVTEKPGLLKDGSMINIIIVDGKMKFELNQDLTKKANLQISSELRRLAILS